MISPFFRRKLPLLAALLSLAVAAPAVAEEAPPKPTEDNFFTTTNVQLLWGGGFSDAQLGYQTKTESMFTLTLNNYTQFKYGDSFFFVDMYQGDFVKYLPNGTQVPNGNAALYAEWHPRILINKFIDPKAPPAFGFIGNWGVAGEINVGNNFSAYLLGPSVDLFLPWNIYVGMAFYYRYSQLWLPPNNQGFAGGSVYTHTWQFSPYWTVPFAIGPVPFLFTGFLDMYQYSTGGMDVMFQPELLVDVLAPFGGKKNTFFAGIEWYLHSYVFDGGTRHTVSAPQVMVQWNIH
ncbi:MAG TPA: ion channel protein Tsx [Anaeromyxobacteraceae bacterium]|nr:ion channel protein Tsx [Anaeromyxobacteraceae bacterium]